jgi:hypothetical protein
MKRSGHRQDYLILNFYKITQYLSINYETIRGIDAIKKIRLSRRRAATVRP